MGEREMAASATREHDTVKKTLQRVENYFSISHMALGLQRWLHCSDGRKRSCPEHERTVAILLTVSSCCLLISSLWYGWQRSSSAVFHEDEATADLEHRRPWLARVPNPHNNTFLSLAVVFFTLTNAVFVATLGSFD